jgi:cell division protein FtsW
MTSPRAAQRTPARSYVNPASITAVCALGLSFLGLAILFSASAWFKNKQGVAVPYLYLSKQAIGILLAGVVCFVVSRVDLDYLRRYAWWIAGGFLVLLGLVLIPGIGVWRGGSRRWLGVGPMVIQISEFAKLGLVFCLAHYLAVQQNHVGTFKRGLFIPLLIAVSFAGLVLCQPDFGTAALMVFVALLLLYLAGTNFWYLATTGVLFTGAFALAVWQNPNRLHRLLEFMSEEKSYQLRQGLAALAVGGVDGVGLGQGRQQLNYLPEAHTDMIFAVIGEELGLWFTLAVVVVFAIIFCAGLAHLRRAPNPFHYLLAAGCVLLLTLQAIVNIAVVTGLFPTKGMSLPFISAGLSNLLMMGGLIGIIWNTQRTWGRAALSGRDRTRREDFE